MDIATFLIYLVVFVIVFGFIFWLLEKVPLDANLKYWVRIVVVAVAVILLILFLLSLVGVTTLRIK